MAESVVFVENLKKFRKSRNLTQKELSNKSGVSLGIIKQLETGRSSTTDENFRSLAGILEVPVYELYKNSTKNTKIIPILNSKGGCSKTTVAQNLSYELSQLDYKVLMVDADLQCNLSYAMDYDFESSPNLYTALLGSTYAKPVDIKEYIVETKYKNLDMVGNTFGMATVDDDLYAKSYREQIMKNIFTPLLKEGIYDFIIFDCNPNLSITNKNIMHFADSIIIPVELTPFGVMGMNVLLNFISNAKIANPKLEIFGILQANVDKRYSMNKLAQKSLKHISKEFGVEIFKSIISTDSNVGKSQWERKPLGPYIKENNIYSRAREDFRSLANELLERMKLENE